MASPGTEVIVEEVPLHLSSVYLWDNMSEVETGRFSLFLRYPRKKKGEYIFLDPTVITVSISQGHISEANETDNW